MQDWPPPSKKEIFVSPQLLRLVREVYWFKHSILIRSDVRGAVSVPVLEAARISLCPLWLRDQAFQYAEDYYFRVQRRFSNTYWVWFSKNETMAWERHHIVISRLQPISEIVSSLSYLNRWRMHVLLTKPLYIPISSVLIAGACAAD